MVRMPWLKMRLAMALASLPATALAVSGCVSGGTTPQNPNPPIVHSDNDADANRDPAPPPVVPVVADDDDDDGEQIPVIDGDHWCGPPTQAWVVANGEKTEAVCPGSMYIDDSEWAPHTVEAERRTEQTGEATCCFTRQPDPGLAPDTDTDVYPKIIEGRPLLVEGVVRTASAGPAHSWAAHGLIDASLTEGLTPSERNEIASRWTHNALVEHASVASFARATLELMAVGAPPSLIAAAQRAASDEVRHAQMCFAVASSYAGTDIGPGPLRPAAPRDLDLVRLAVSTFVEGCVPESIGAFEAARLADRAAPPALRRILHEISVDETRHAELAWSTVGWAARTGGQPVVTAVLAAAGNYEMPAKVAATPIDDKLAVHGLMTDAERSECMQRGWHALIVPLLDELVGRSTSDVLMADVRREH